jgi:hypothetical protein
MGMIEMFSVHIDDVVLLYLPRYLAQVFGLFAIASQRGLHEKIIEEILQCLALKVVVAFVDADDSHLLVLPYHLLVLLLIRGDIY